MTWGERLGMTAAALVLAVLVTVGIGILVAPGVRPILSYTDGSSPEETPSYGCSPLRESGVPCQRERDYRWALRADGTIRTTWHTSRSDTDEVHGVLALSREECPQARASWTLTAAGHTSSGVLTADNPADILAAELSGDQDRITLEFRRTDNASCAAVAEWKLARAEAPWLGFLWSWL